MASPQTSLMQDVTAGSSEDAARQAALKASGAIPRHVAIIMDGNGRWAQARGQHRFIGHHEGVVSVRDVTEAAVEIGVEHLTLYTFSTENWHRPQPEVEALMALLVALFGARRSDGLDAYRAVRAALEIHDRILRMDHVELAAGATLGPHGIVLPGATVGAHAAVGPASLVMRGEHVPDGTRWLGNPISAWR